MSFPELDGINVEDALPRMAGNENVFRKVLKTFYDKYQTFGKELIEKLDEGDRTTAERLAHTLKGVAGTIGAEVLFKITSELDLELKKEDFDRKTVEELLENNEKELQRVFKSIKDEILKNE